ncbi:MAG: DNA gyrase subunit A [Oscillospiraceae bacterium]|jgi:DNA gyrase subunit A|nr:DNA gyrase subunit A [Oscillospiraceae bacterium]
MAKTKIRQKKNPDISFPNQTIKPIEIVKEMRESFIDYSMSVIAARALPDVRDGLKPVHRRIIYSMNEEGFTPDKGYRKSAACVAPVMGNYHPHGDSSIYDALVRLAQDFTQRHTLVDGHGNFGSIHIHAAAASRYTEARMSRLAAELVRDIDKETVDFDRNYDETRWEPSVLPSHFPNLLVNGSQGIAVGMATNIPPHNLGEVINAVICVIRDPEATLADLMEHIKGPDFPTGGVVVGYSGIRAAYATGRGNIKLRAKTEIATDERGNTEIIVHDIPYQQVTKQLLTDIDNKLKDKSVEGISSFRDETDMDGFRLVFELRRDANPQVVLNQLFAHTPLQITFGVILLALVNRGRQPKILTLREILDEYIAHQLEVIVRRTTYDLRKAKERAHILEGLRIAVDNIDEVIRIIRTSYNDAKERLMERFGLSEAQTDAILALQLRRLQGLEREKIEAEYREILQKIEYFNSVLASEELQKDILIEELTEIKNKYADERRTEMQIVEDEIDIEDLIPEEECVFTLTREGYIKRMSADTYKVQGRGGKGIMGMTTRHEDYVDMLCTASTHDLLLFFTNRGRVYREKGYKIPSGARTFKGVNIVNIIQAESGEKVTAMLHFRDLTADDKYLFMATRKGTVKRLRVSELKNIRNIGIRALNLDEGDELFSVSATDGNDNILLATKFGQAICFNEQDVRIMGRSAVGVRGIRLFGDDECVGAGVLRESAKVLTVTENGYGKRTDAEEYLRNDEAQHRGGKGRRNGTVNEKTGFIADIKIVDGDEDILLITDGGTIIRMSADTINNLGRTAQGVRLMRVPDGVKVKGVALTASGGADDDDSSDSSAEPSGAVEVELEGASESAEESEPSAEPPEVPQ